MSEENPDYAGPEATALRNEASQHADQRHHFLDAANKAFEAGDKALAKQLSEQGKEAGRKMEEANKKAATSCLKHRNDGHGYNYLDLHGLFLLEAMAALTERLDLLGKKGNSVILEVIPGAGHHSKAGAVIKPKVIEELRRRHLTFTEKNAGTMLVTIEGKTPLAGGFEASSSTAPAKSTEKASKGGCCVVM